jgi:hypothetical protein
MSKHGRLNWIGIALVANGGMTMRLVDADALCTHIEKEFDGVCVYDVSGNEAAREFCDMVDIAPTIAAIPVEWLEGLKEKLYGNFNGLAYRMLLDVILNMWQKEQEAQDE